MQKEKQIAPFAISLDDLSALIKASIYPNLAKKLDVSEFLEVSRKIDEVFMRLKREGAVEQ